MEHVISDRCLAAIRRQCYEAGRAGREVYTVRDADGPEVVRCRDCSKWHESYRVDESQYGACDNFTREDETCVTRSDGFCAWGERRNR